MKAVLRPRPRRSGAISRTSGTQAGERRPGPAGGADAVDREHRHTVRVAVLRDVQVPPSTGTGKSRMSFLVPVHPPSIV